METYEDINRIPIDDKMSTELIGNLLMLNISQAEIRIQELLIKSLERAIQILKEK